MKLHEPLEQLFDRINTRPMTLQEITQTARSATRMEAGCNAAEKLKEVQSSIVSQALEKARTSSPEMNEAEEDLIRQLVTLLLRQGVFALAVDDNEALCTLALEMQPPLLNRETPAEPLHQALESLRDGVTEQFPAQTGRDLDVYLRSICQFLTCSAALGEVEDRLKEQVLLSLERDPEATPPRGMSSVQLKELIGHVLRLPLAELLPDDGSHGFSVLAAEHNRLERMELPYAFLETLLQIAQQLTESHLPAEPTLPYSRAFQRCRDFLLLSANLIQEKKKIIGSCIEQTREQHGNKINDAAKNDAELHHDLWQLLETVAAGTHPSGKKHFFDELYARDGKISKMRPDPRMLADMAQALLQSARRHLRGNALKHFDRLLHQTAFFLAVSADVAEHGDALTEQAMEELEAQHAEQLSKYPRQTSQMKLSWERLLWAVRFGLLPGWEGHCSEMVDGFGYVLANRRFFDDEQMVRDSFDLLENHVKRSFTKQSLAAFLPLWRQYRAGLEACLEMSRVHEDIVAQTIESIQQHHAGEMRRIPEASMLAERDINTVLYSAAMAMLPGTGPMIVRGLSDLRDSFREHKLDREMMRDTFRALEEQANTQLPGAATEQLKQHIKEMADAIEAMAAIAECEEKITEGVARSLTQSHNGDVSRHAGALRKTREDAALMLYGAAFALAPGGDEMVAQRLDKFANAIIDSPIDSVVMSDMLTLLGQMAEKNIDAGASKLIQPVLERMETAVRHVAHLSIKEQEIVDQASKRALQDSAEGQKPGAGDLKRLLRSLLRRSLLTGAPGGHALFFESVQALTTLIRCGGDLIGETYSKLLRAAQNAAKETLPDSVGTAMDRQLGELVSYTELAAELAHSEKEIVREALEALYNASEEYMQSFPRSREHVAHDMSWLLWSSAPAPLPGAEKERHRIVRIMSVVVENQENYDESIMKSVGTHLEQAAHKHLSADNAKKLSTQVHQTIQAFA